MKHRLYGRNIGYGLILVQLVHLGPDRVRKTGGRPGGGHHQIVGHPENRVGKIQLGDSFTISDVVDGVIHHANDQERIIREIHRRLCKPWDANQPSQSIAKANVPVHESPVYDNDVRAVRHFGVGEETSRRQTNSQGLGVIFIRLIHFNAALILLGVFRHFHG